MKTTRQHDTLKKVSPVLQSAAKFVIITALSRTPAGLAARVLNRVGRKPVRIALALVLEPALSAIMKKVSARLFREKHEETAK